MKIKSCDFLYVKDYMLNDKKVSGKLKEQLLDKSNYTIVENGNLIYNSDDFYELFNEELAGRLIDTDICECTYEFDDGYIASKFIVCKIGEKYFYYSVVYEDTVEGFQEVEPLEVKIKAFKFKSGGFTDSDLSKRIVK